MPFKIKELREKKKMTRENLCKKAGISRQTLSDLESGREVNTTTATLKKLADALGCKIGKIFLP